MEWEVGQEAIVTENTKVALSTHHKGNACMERGYVPTGILRLGRCSKQGTETDVHYMLTRFLDSLGEGRIATSHISDYVNLWEREGGGGEGTCCQLLYSQ